jgi:hypothetical protein
MSTFRGWSSSSPPASVIDGIITHVSAEEINAALDVVRAARRTGVDQFVGGQRPPDNEVGRTVRAPPFAGPGYAPFANREQASGS